jgi:hypothetical protein
MRLTWQHLALIVNIPKVLVRADAHSSIIKGN